MDVHFWSWMLFQTQWAHSLIPLAHQALWGLLFLQSTLTPPTSIWASCSNNYSPLACAHSFETSLSLSYGIHHILFFLVFPGGPNQGYHPVHLSVIWATSPSLRLSMKFPTICPGAAQSLHTVGRQEFVNLLFRFTLSFRESFLTLPLCVPTSLFNDLLILKHLPAWDYGRKKPLQSPLAGLSPWTHPFFPPDSSGSSKLGPWEVV